MTEDDLFLRSRVFPGGNLFRAYFDRDVVRLSDRGRASNLIGDRWSDVAASALERLIGTTISLPGLAEVRIEHVHRLDTIPSIARIASKRKLQNPDFVVSVLGRSGRFLLSVDAKFSVETARSAQVSAETLRELLAVGPLITSHLDGVTGSDDVVDGMFLSPDTDLTHYMMASARGRHRSSVRRDEVLLIPTGPDEFLAPLEGSALVPFLADLDGLDRQSDSNMLLSLYYFRLARACFGCYADETAPVIGHGTQHDSRGATDVDVITDRAGDADSAWHLVVLMDRAAEQAREERTSINALLVPHINSAGLREQLVTLAAERDVEAPSANRVRKAVTRWYSQEVIGELGTVLPPVSDLDRLKRDISLIKRDLDLLLPDRIERAIAEAFAVSDQQTDDSI